MEEKNGAALEKCTSAKGRSLFVVWQITIALLLVSLGVAVVLDNVMLRKMQAQQQIQIQALTSVEEQLNNSNKISLKQAQLELKLTQVLDERLNPLETKLQTQEQWLTQAHANSREWQLLSVREELRLAAYHAVHRHSKTQVAAHLAKALEILKILSSPMTISLQEKVQAAQLALEALKPVDRVALWKILENFSKECKNAAEQLSLEAPSPAIEPTNWQGYVQQSLKNISDLIRIRDYRDTQRYLTLEDRRRYLLETTWALEEAKLALLQQNVEFFHLALTKALDSIHFLAKQDPASGKILKELKEITQYPLEETWPDLSPTVEEIDALLQAKHLG